MFFSFRSPYSYIALPRAYALADHYGLTLRLRPVLPTRATLVDVLLGGVVTGRGRLERSSEHLPPRPWWR